MSKKRKRKKYRDQFGIYELNDYKPGRKKKKKKKFNLKNLFRLTIVFFALVVLAYGVVYGLKYSMYDKAYSLYEINDYEGAASLMKESLNPRLPFLSKFDNNVRLYLADCYVNIGKYGSACSQYERIKVWSDESDEKVNYLLNVAYGLQLYEWKEYKDALPILLDAYEKGYGDLILFVGSCYGQIGDMENMQLYYNVFLKDHTMNSFMYAQYAAIALDEGRLDEAYNYIDNGLKLDDKSNIRELLFDEIVYYEKLKDYNTAFTKAKAFVEQYPSDKDGKNEYDLLYTRQSGETDKK